MTKKKKPNRDILVSHKGKVKEVSIKPHNDDISMRGDIKEHKNRPGISLSIKIND